MASATTVEDERREYSAPLKPPLKHSCLEISNSPMEKMQEIRVSWNEGSRTGKKRDWESCEIRVLEIGFAKMKTMVGQRLKLMGRAQVERTGPNRRRACVREKKKRLCEWVKLEQLDLDSVEAGVDVKSEAIERGSAKISKVQIVWCRPKELQRTKGKAVAVASEESLSLIRKKLREKKGLDTGTRVWVVVNFVEEESMRAIAASWRRAMQKVKKKRGRGGRISFSVVVKCVKKPNLGKLETRVCDKKVCSEKESLVELGQGAGQVLDLMDPLGQVGLAQFNEYSGSLFWKSVDPAVKHSALGQAGMKLMDSAEKHVILGQSGDSMHQCLSPLIRFFSILGYKPNNGILE